VTGKRILGKAEKRRVADAARSRRRYRLRKAGQGCLQIKADIKAVERMLDENQWRGETLADALSAWIDAAVTPWKQRK